MIRGACLGLTLLTASAFAGEIAVSIVDDNGAPVPDSIAYAVARNSAPPATAQKQTQVDQINKMFLPDVSVIRTGTPVSFPNSDNIRHHVYSFSPAKVFDLKLYSGRPSTPVIFDKPGVVTLGCNIHDQMIAWILVVDTAWFAKADAQGRAKIANLPDGEYELHVWHPGLKGESPPQSMRVAGSTTALTTRIPARSIQQLRSEVTNASAGGGR